ncbi:Holliday junction branch migration protein RuvA [Desulfogranum marinum]|uniref:Holliday junction branch migration protein RuvA n=1 Tax=Desulfogranum marinum TaxID=453220 RepID=UPI0029C83D9B|nr:Holliday junction branch migration protein RuvA [Desulfogranum marinum]
MIASLNGIVRSKSPGSIVLDVQGVGYEVFISSRTYDLLPAIGEECFLLIQTNVREDAITLFGFEKQETKKLFLLLVTVSGIGPKLALAILSGLGSEELTTAISMEDYARLTAISGVGKKTAQRLCVELGEKVGRLAPSGVEGQPSVVSGSPAQGNAVQDAVSALINLGYPQHLAWQALRRVQKQHGEGADAMAVEELIRLALQGLA